MKKAIAALIVMLACFSATAEYPESVTITAVGPRDGLQPFDPVVLGIDRRVMFIDLLRSAGFKHIEVGAFVHPKSVPQMAKTDSLLKRLEPANVTYTVVVPNQKGYEKAVAAGAKSIAVLCSASDMYSQKNVKKSKQDALTEAIEIIHQAKAAGMFVKAYISCAFHSPYENEDEIDQEDLIRTIQSLHDAKANEIAISDTTGRATPCQVKRFFHRLLTMGTIPPSAFSVHFHDTHDRALANTLAALKCGISKVDTSIAGLGGSPSLPDAGGNLSTEVLVSLLSDMGIATNINLKSLAEVLNFARDCVGKQPTSNTGKRLLRQFDTADSSPDFRL